MKCPEGGCPKYGRIKNILLGHGAFGVIWCDILKDVSWHPISQGIECPVPDKLKGLMEVEK